MNQKNDLVEGKASPGGPGGKVAILLVDDDINNLIALESILNSEDFELVRAQTSDAALLALMHGDFAAIVLDVQMPGLNGIELARLIKQRKRTQNIPILFLTAHYLETEHAVLAYDVGAVDYLTKPVHPAVLRSKVGVFVDLFRKTRALAAMNQIMEAEIIERKTAVDRLRVIVEAAPSAMVVFTYDGEIKLVNSQAETLFCFPRDQLIERRIVEFLDPGSLGVLPNGGSEHDAAETRSAAKETVIRRRDGSEAAVEVSITPFQSGEGPRLLASIVDIAERKRAEEALRTANAELEEKNIALERQAAERILRIRAEAAQAEAEAANAAKDRFLAMLSHELRTPLSPVLHTVTLLEETVADSRELKEHLETIRRNVQLEARLIDDLLDIARIRNGKLNLQIEPTNAHEVLQHALGICKPAITARDLRVDLKLDARRIWLRADPARLQQIFWNLISNAVKFTPNQGSIAIATSDNEAKGCLEVRIADTGVGIDETKLSQIFNAFEQGTHQGSSGLGLGLAICKALTEFHGGTIQAHSEGKGMGMRFTVSFPASVKGPTPATPERSVPTLQGSVALRLLVVEDHADTAATLCNLLVRRGYAVQAANSFKAALQLANDFQFDVLLSDVGLPDGNGTELLGELRRLSGNDSLRGIALSGFGMDEDIERSRKAGFDDHLTKPIDFNVLDRCLIEIGRKLAEPAVA